MVKTSAGTASSAVAEAAPPVAPAHEFFATPKPATNGHPLAALKEKFDSRKEELEPAVEAVEVEVETEEEEDPAVLKARRYLVRKGHEADYLESLDAEKLFSLKDRVQKHERKQDAVLEDNATLRRRLDELEATSRREPDRVKPAGQPREVSTKFKEQWGEDGAKSLAEFVGSFVEESGASHDQRLRAVETALSKLDERETQLHIRTAIGKIEERFLDLEDSAERRRLQNRMTYLAADPEFRELAKSEGPEAAFDALAVSAAKSLDLEEEEEAKPKDKRPKAKPVARGERRVSTRKLEGNDLKIEIARRVLSKPAGTNRVENTLREMSLKRR